MKFSDDAKLIAAAIYNVDGASKEEAWRAVGILIAAAPAGDTASVAPTAQTVEAASTDEADALRAERDAAINYQNALRGEIHRLQSERDALTKWAMHRRGCTSTVERAETECSCGLTQILSSSASADSTSLAAAAALDKERG